MVDALCTVLPSGSKCKGTEGAAALTPIQFVILTSTRRQHALMPKMPPQVLQSACNFQSSKHFRQGAALAMN